MTTELLKCCIPDYPDDIVAPLPECYTTLISLSTSKASKTSDVGAPLCTAVTSNIGLLGCSGGELVRWDVLTKNAQILSLSIGTTPAPQVSPFSGLSSATSAAAAASGFTRAARTTDKAEVREAFLSPAGLHGLVGLSNGENCYISSQNTSYRPLATLKDIQIRCICWDGREAPNPNTTNEILIGTMQGVIFSAVISGGRERNVRPLLTLPQKTPIVQIFVYELPKRPQNESVSTAASSVAPFLQTTLAIVVASATNMYLFVGGSTIEHALQASYCSGRAASTAVTTSDDSIERILSNVVFECPKECLFSELHSTPIQQTTQTFCVGKTSGSDDMKPKKGALFWWLTGVGIIVSCLTLTETTAEISSHPLVIPFSPKVSPASKISSSKSSQIRLRSILSQSSPLTCPEIAAARSIAITDDHVLLLYETRLDVVSRVTRRQIESLSLPPVRYGAARCLVTDSITGCIFLLTSRYLFNVEMKNEHSGVWKEFLDIGDHQSALAAVLPLSKENDYICCELGKLNLREGRAKEAAEALSGCESIPLEDILIQLTYLGHGHNNAIISLIDDRLRRLNDLSTRSTSSSSILATHLGVAEACNVGMRLWVLELALRGLNSCELNIEHLKYLRQLKSREKTTVEGETQLSQRITNSIAERKRLLQIVMGLMSKLKSISDQQTSTAIYHICESLGRQDEARTWAKLTGDLDTQMLQCFLDRDPHGALMCLTTPFEPKSSSGSRANWLARQVFLFARYGPQLFHEEPSTFSVLLLHPQLLASTAPYSLSKWVEEVVVKNSIALSSLLPALLPCVVNGALGDLHRCEALKLLERLLLGASKKPHEVKSQSGRDSIVPLSWMGLSGIWNLMVTLLASCSGTEGDLLRRLHTLSEEPYFGLDFYFLLRLCCELGHRRGVAILLSLVGMHADSVHVALAGGDLDLAKLAARRAPQTSEWQKRRLWKCVAEVAAKTLEPPDLLLLLNESNGMLRLHENLQHISSSDIIGAFRQELCSAFEAAEARIKEKHADIEHNRKALANLKAKIKEQRATPVPQMIDSKTPCAFCQHCACLDRFYLFPCGHCIHSICAHKLKWPFLGQERKEEYRRAVISLCTALYSPEYTTESMKVDRVHDLKEAAKAIDAVLAEECLLCGIHMIQVIGVPFLSKSEIDDICPSLTSSGLMNTARVSPWRIGGGPLPKDFNEP